MVFARKIDDGTLLTFGVSGKLIRNAVVMYDHQTDTLWSQFLMMAVEGPLTGTQLELLPAQLTTWGAWLEQHPETKLLDRRIGRANTRDPYASYYRSSQAGVLGESNPDDRLTRKELVLGLHHGRERVAYAFSHLADVPVVNDSYDGEAVVVTYDAAGSAAAAFSSNASGQDLTFEEVGPITMRDVQTSTTWHKLSGEAIDGPLAGQSLSQLPSFVAFWFSWTDFYPSTRLVGGAS